MIFGEGLTHFSVESCVIVGYGILLFLKTFLPLSTIWKGLSAAGVKLSLIVLLRYYLTCGILKFLASSAWEGLKFQPSCLIETDLSKELNAFGKA